MEFQQISFFLFLISSTEESFIYGLIFVIFNHVTDFIFQAINITVINIYASGFLVLLFKPYFAKLNFPLLNILSKKKSHIFTQLAHLIFKSFCFSHLSCSQNCIQRREVYASYLLSFILYEGLLIQHSYIRILIIKIHASKFYLPMFMHLILCNRRKSILPYLPLSIFYLGIQQYFFL